MSNTGKREKTPELSPKVPLQDRESILKLWNVINSGKRYSKILEYVDNEIKESTRVVEFNYKISGFLSDTAYALSKAIEEKIGFVKQNSGNKPSNNRPEMIDITFADGSHKKVPFGRINLPSFGSDAFVDMEYNSIDQITHITGICEKRFVTDLDDVIDLTNEILKTDSIYKGKAIKLDDNKEPSFINISSVDKVNLYLTAPARFSTNQIEARIEHTEECIKNNIDLKYGVLLEGTYGTGKTLYAFKLANKAIKNGWTFIYCDDAQKTLEAIKISHRYCHNGKGVVLFIEDVDKILAERNNITNEISILMDGGENKNIPFISIFTTNHIEKIDPTFLRGKRIGSIITLTHPDVKTAKRMLEGGLVDSNNKSLLEPNTDITEAAELIEEKKIVPAFIAEIIDQVKTYRILQKSEYVTTEDIINSIKAYDKQISVSKLQEHVLTPELEFANGLRDVIGLEDKLEESKKDIINTIKEIY